MSKDINDLNLETIISKLSQKSGLTIASSRNLLTLNDDSSLASKLNILPSDLNLVFNGESSSLIANKFDLTNAELQNLIDELGKEFVIGMLFAKLILKHN